MHMVKNRYTALVIDDEFFDREPVKLILERLGYEVIQAEDGVDGVEKFIEYKPGLVILDCNMPKMNGIEALLRMRAYEKDNAEKSCIVAATSMFYSKEDFHAAGVNHFLEKPLLYHDLSKIVK